MLQFGMSVDSCTSFHTHIETLKDSLLHVNGEKNGGLVRERPLMIVSSCVEEDNKEKILYVVGI